MEISLEGKVALVTGASRGIGRAIAETYVRAGAAVMLSSRKEDALRAVADGLPGRQGRGVRGQRRRPGRGGGVRGRDGRAARVGSTSS